MANSSTRRLTALVLGGGRVAQHLVECLLNSPRYESVRLLVRRRLPVRHEKLQQYLVGYDHLGEHARIFDADHVFCCVGGTVRPVRTWAAVRKVDYAYPYRVAQLAAAKGVGHFVWISAVGAAGDARINYLRVKGELEQDIARLPLAACTAVRPALVLSPRRERQPVAWVATQLVRPLGPLLRGPWRKYRVTTPTALAESMLAVANGRSPAPGLEVVRYRRPSRGAIAPA